MSKKSQSISMQIAAKVIEAMDAADGIRVEVDPIVHSTNGDVWLQIVIAQAIRTALQ
jgi:hypothetical protein